MIENINLSQIKTKNKNKKQVIVRPVKIPRNIERQYQAQIKAYSNTFKQAVITEIFPLIKEYTADGIGDNINTILSGLTERFGLVANNIASTMVNRVVSVNGKKTKTNINNAIGVDVENIIESENLSEFVELQIIANTELIKSVPSDAIGDIRRIIINGLTGGLRADDIEKLITNTTFKKINNRIATIARTETAKINSQIANRRYLNLGITKAVWDATGDSRTRDCHRVRDGKIFNINEGLYSSCDGKTLQPGQDFNCRCVARPIIE